MGNGRAPVAASRKMSGRPVRFSVVAAPGKEYKDYVRAADRPERSFRAECQGMSGDGRDNELSWPKGVGVASCTRRWIGHVSGRRMDSFLGGESHIGKSPD